MDTFGGTLAPAPRTRTHARTRAREAILGAPGTKTRSEDGILGKAFVCGMVRAREK